MKAIVYNQDGKKVDEMELSEGVFGLPWNADLVHQVAVSMAANKRIPWAHAKDRSEVSGGGRKPWRQKGTGRARHGSTRSPIWRKGGVTHGPLKEKIYTQKINKKMRKKAFLTVLSQKLRDSEILFLNKLIIPKPKTKEAGLIINSLSKIKNFEKLGTKKKNRAILALPKKDSDAERSFRNLPGLQISQFKNLNALDLLNFKYLVIANPEEALK